MEPLPIHITEDLLGSARIQMEVSEVIVVIVVIVVLVPEKLTETRLLNNCVLLQGLFVEILFPICF